MSYPESIDRFHEKLNKKVNGAVHSIEETVTLAAGKYEDWLAHDNVVISSVKVYSGLKLTGREITTWNLSASAESPWKHLIRIFDTETTLYVSYQTPGDTVEAHDINALQTAVSATQEELERYKDEGVIDGGTFHEG